VPCHCNACRPGTERQAAHDPPRAPRTALAAADAVATGAILAPVPVPSGAEVKLAVSLYVYPARAFAAIAADTFSTKLTVRPGRDQRAVRAHQRALGTALDPDHRQSALRWKGQGFSRPRHDTGRGRSPTLPCDDPGDERRKLPPANRPRAKTRPRRLPSRATPKTVE
jgi:hypothetical protein